MRNGRVMELFTQREEASNQYLTSDSDRLYSFDTIVAEWDYPILYINNNTRYVGYANTLVNMLDEDVEIVFVNNVPIGAKSLTNIEQQ